MSTAKCRKSKKRHTPITSEAQQGKFGAELGRRRTGKARKMRGITTEELESHLKESKGRKLPKRKGKSDRYDRADLKARQKQRQRRAG